MARPATNPVAAPAVQIKRWGDMPFVLSLLSMRRDKSCPNGTSNFVERFHTEARRHGGRRISGRQLVASPTHLLMRLRRILDLGSNRELSAPPCLRVKDPCRSAHRVPLRADACSAAQVISVHVPLGHDLSRLVGRTSDGRSRQGRKEDTMKPLLATLIAALVAAVGTSGLALAQAQGGCNVPCGTFLREWGCQSCRDGDFNDATGVAVDGNGDVYVVDRANNRIQKFDRTGTFLAKWGTPGSGNGQFNSPYAVAVDGSGNVFVADVHNNPIHQIHST